MLKEEELFLKNVVKAAELIKNAKYCVVLTGSAINQPIGLPEIEEEIEPYPYYPNTSKSLSLIRQQASPTATYMAIFKLFSLQMVKSVITTTMEGLHQRSGIPSDKVFELFGNCFTETCSDCKKIYNRDFDVTTPRSQFLSFTRRSATFHPSLASLPPITLPNGKQSFIPSNPHLTGRFCMDRNTNRTRSSSSSSSDSDVCGGFLLDTIVHNGDITRQAMGDAVRECEKADVLLCIGTNLAVSPICELPVVAKQKKGKVIIMYTKKTALDPIADVAPCGGRLDVGMRLLMGQLQIDVPQYVLHRSLLIGNEYEELKEADRQFFEEQNSHKWTLFVRNNSSFPVSSFLEKVEFFLPPLLYPSSTIVLESEPFEITRVGSDPFEIQIGLHIIANGHRSMVKTSHTLKFSGKGSVINFELQMSGLIEAK